MGTHSEIKIEIKGDANRAIAPFRHELKKITVFLGANGSGKTKLLNEIVKDAARLVGVEDVIQIPTNERAQDRSFSDEGSGDRALREFKESRRQAFPGSTAGAGLVRNSDLLQVLYKEDFDSEREELNQYRDHKDDPENYPLPSPPRLHFEEICTIFSETMDVQLSFDRKAEKFFASAKYGSQSKFTIDQLSSGEAWVFNVLPAFSYYRDKPMIVFVDEPESFLNERLAIDFWTYIERSRPDWRFVYSTHNVSFASRENVDDIFIVRSPVEEPTKISSVSDLSADEQRKLLGVGPRLISAPKALFVEGQNSSRDVPFYSAVLNDKRVLVVSIGSSNEVKKAVAQSDYWGKLELDSSNLYGCIDRDYHRGTTSDGRTAMLELHDLEAYLCLPELLAKIGDVLTGETRVSAYRDEILKFANENKWTTICKYLDKSFSIGPLGVSIPKKDRVSTNRDEIVETYAKRRDSAVTKILDDISDEVIAEKTNEVLSAIDAAISSGQVEEVLKWFSGKPLFEDIKGLANLVNAEQAIKLAVKHNLGSEVAEWKQLAEKLTKMLGIR